MDAIQNLGAWLYGVDDIRLLPVELPVSLGETWSLSVVVVAHLSRQLPDILSF